MYYQNVNGLVSNWNKTLSVLAKISDVPVALVMKLDKEDITVFCKNDSENNPCHSGDSMKLIGSGIYCEEVLKTRKLLNIPNALSEKKWDKRPSLLLDLIAYLGMPIFNGDGTPFGTVCILDTKEHLFLETTIDLLETIKDSFEVQLKMLYQQHIDEKKLQYEELTILIKGISHEITAPLATGITTASIIDFNIEKLQQKLISKSLSKKELLSSLNVMQESVKLLSRNFDLTEEKLNTLQNLLIDDDYPQGEIKSLIPIVQDVVRLYDHKRGNYFINYKVIFNKDECFETFIIPSLLQEAIFVLLKNSAKHAFKNISSPEISLNLKNYNKIIQLHYKDNGVGIDKEHFKNIFTPLYKANPDNGLSGMGLSIAKRIITQQLGGDITIEEAPLGVHFIISLPNTIK